ncbi:MAG: hypothetical protein Q9213_001143 [Squamulea squamosa]
MRAQPARKPSYPRYIKEALQEGNILVECKGWSAADLHSLNDHTSWEDITTTDVNPVNSNSDALNDIEDTPSPNGSHVVPTHYIYSFDGPRKRGRGLVFGSDNNTDFRLPGCKPTATRRTISRKSFCIFINEVDAWMLSTLARNACTVNDDRLCARKCQNQADPKKDKHMEHLWHVALRPDDTNRVQILDIELSIRVPDAGDRRSAWGLNKTLPDPEFASITSQTSETSSSQLSGVQTVFSRGHEPVRNKYIELAESLIPSNGIYTIKTVIDKRTGIKALAKINQRPGPGYLRDETLQRVYRMLRSLCEDERYFVNPLEAIEIPSGFAIITEYRNAQLLEACEPDLTNTDLLLLFAQIGGGAL